MKKIKKWSPPPSSFKSQLKYYIKRVIGWPVYPYSEPNYKSLQLFIAQNLSVNQKKDSMFTTISVNTSEPEVAKFLIENSIKLQMSLSKIKALLERNNIPFF